MSFARRPTQCVRADCDRPAFGKLCTGHNAQLRRRASHATRHALRAESAKRAAQRPARRAREAELGREGIHGICARCGLYGYVNGHERRGGNGRRDMTNPDCLLDVLCNGWCEDNPRRAAWDGWKVSGKYDRDPELQPNQARRLDGSVFTFEDVAA